VVRSHGIGPYTFKLRLSIDSVVANVQAVSLVAASRLTAGTWRLTLSLTGSVSVRITEPLDFDASSDMVREAVNKLENVALVDVTRSSQLENSGESDPTLHKFGHTWMITVIPSLDAPGISGEADRWVPQWDSGSGASQCDGCTAFSTAGVTFEVEEVNAPGNTYSAEDEQLPSYMQPPGHYKVAGVPLNQVS
jgi:hypothetical protein